MIRGLAWRFGRCEFRGPGRRNRRGHARLAKMVEGGNVGRGRQRLQGANWLKTRGEGAARRELSAVKGWIVRLKRAGGKGDAVRS